MAISAPVAAVVARKRRRVSLLAGMAWTPSENGARRAIMVGSTTVRSKPHAHSASVGWKSTPISRARLAAIRAAAPHQNAISRRRIFHLSAATAVADCDQERGALTRNGLGAAGVGI